MNFISFAFSAVTRFFAGKSLILAGIAVVSLTMGGLYWWGSTKAKEVQYLKTELVILEQNVTYWKSEHDTVRQLLEDERLISEERSKQNQILESQLLNSYNALDNLRNQNEDVKKYTDTPIPPDILKWLSEEE